MVRLVLRPGFHVARRGDATDGDVRQAHHSGVSLMARAREVLMPATAMGKPVAEKLNPAWGAAVRRMLGAAPRPKVPVRTRARKPLSQQNARHAYCNPLPRHQGGVRS